MNHKERMMAGLPFQPWMDGLEEERTECRRLLQQFNNLMPGEWDEQDRLLRQILGSAGEGAYIEPQFHCDYGYNIELGDNFYANFNLVILDGAKVRIGDNVLIAPNVAIYTATHPIHPEDRNTGFEYNREIKIGNNVWIGGNVCILPGVVIGDNSVIGAGSVITKDIPANVVAAGNPCRVIRVITEKDKSAELEQYIKGK